MPDADPELELLAVTLVDMRATVDSMKRSITHAQSSVEQYRHTRGREYIDDIADCLDQLKNEAGAIMESLPEADKPLRRLLDAEGAAPPSS
jgi:hypothetical protein